MRRIVRKDLRQTIEDNQRALDYYALMTGEARIDLKVPAKRQQAPRKPSGNPTEAQIQKAVLAFLQRHPKVEMAWRVNSGTFVEQNRDGSLRYIRANTQRGMADIMGVLRDGRTIALEVKSLTGKVQPHQQEFLDRIRGAGGVAGVVRSVEDAVALLVGA